MRAPAASSADQLETLETNKGAWLVFRTMEKGQSTAELIPEIVKASLDKLPIPKRMRWGDRGCGVRATGALGGAAVRR